MGFFKNAGKTSRKLPIELLHRLQCKVCPLNKLTINKHPHMPASGAKKPIVYVLGDAPGAAEDKNGKHHFIGDSGQLLRQRIPKRWLEQIRWNNVVRTRPPNNRAPEPIEVEACRPSVEKDIAASKPKAIFGMGAAPLSWATGLSGVFDWRGRRLPVSIGGHECWFYPMLHPALLFRERRKWATRSTDIGSEDERAFVFDLRRALAEVEGLPDAVVHDEKVAEYGVEIVDGKPGDLARLTSLLEWAGKQKEVGLDYETNRTRPYDKKAKILTAAVGTDELSFSFAIDHPQAKWSKKERKQVLKLWRRFLRSKTTKAVHFLQFEMEWTGFFFGWKKLRLTRWEGTESQASILDERTGRKRKEGPLSLNFLCRQYFGLDVKGISNVNKKRLEFTPLDIVLKYNAIDAKYHYLLFRAQRERLQAEGLMRQYKSAVRRVATCVLTQLKGVPVSPEVTDELDQKYEKVIRRATRKIKKLKVVKRFERSNGEFNPESNEQLAVILRDLLKRSEGFKDEESDKYSVDEETLAKIDHPICKPVLQLRKARKKSSTYLYRDIWPDGLLHSIFNPGIFTVTGRLSSEEPNLQNIPKRDEEAKEIRRQIVAPPGHTILSVDYGQIEARVIAMASKDKAFCKALWDRYDVHGAWAERIARAYPARIGGKQNFTDKGVMKVFRGDIKNQWTFPLFFGAQLSSVAEYLHIPEFILQPEFKAFQKEFAGVFEYQETLLDFYKENGYVEFLTGRRRRAPISRNQLINSPIQGTACEIIMDGMNRLSEKADEEDDWYFQPNINIHDDLTFIVPSNDLAYYAEKIGDEMTKVTFDFINVPLTAEMSMGQNLYEMQEFLVVSSDGQQEWKI